MTVQHSAITDPDIHEPKGVASANAGEVYVADGAGAGAWTGPYITLTCRTELSLSNLDTLPVPVNGTVVLIAMSINATTGGGGSHVNIPCSINGTAITNGSLYVDGATAAIGNYYSVIPSAANTVSVGDVLHIQADGGASSPCRAELVFVIQRSD